MPNKNTSAISKSLAVRRSTVLGVASMIGDLRVDPHVQVTDHPPVGGRVSDLRPGRHVAVPDPDTVMVAGEFRDAGHRRSVDGSGIGEVSLGESGRLLGQ